MATSQICNFPGGNFSIWKLPLGKSHIWEVATWAIVPWEIVPWENAFGKVPNTDLQLPKDREWVKQTDRYILNYLDI